MVANPTYTPELIAGAKAYYQSEIDFIGPVPTEVLWDHRPQWWRDQSCFSFAKALEALANNLPTPADEHDWVLPSAVCAYDIERCKQNGSNYERDHMSITNRMSIAPMIRAAIRQALLSLSGHEEQPAITVATDGR